MLKRITQPAVEPVSLAEAKLHLRVNFTNDDDLISEQIKAAREMCEHEVARSFISTTWRYSFDEFPDHVMLPIADVISVDALTYVDIYGVEQTLSEPGYTLTSGTPTFIYPYHNTSWPNVYDRHGAVAVDFTAGYGATADTVPALAKMAIMLVLGDLYEHREESSEVPLTRIPNGVRWLLSPLNWGGTRV